MNQLKTSGIILKRIDYGEADRIITFLTSDFGKIRAMAKGVRKQKSKLAGGIELFSISEIHFIKGKGDIDTLVSTRLKRHYGGIVKDLKNTELAYSFLRAIDKIVEDKTGNEYFQLLDESLSALNNDEIDLELVEISFAMRVLYQLGQLPEFNTDSKGKRLNESDRYEFDFEAVSFKPRPDGPFDKNHLKVLRLLAHNPPKTIAAVQGIEKLASEVAPLVRGLFNFYAT